MKAKKLLSMALLVVAGGVTAGEISCVTFTGTDYVQTDIVPTVDMRVVCDFQLLELPTGGGVTPVIDPGTVSNAATIVCSHTAEQLAALPVGSHRVTFTTSSADPEMNGRTESVVVTVTEPFTGFAADVEGGERLHAREAERRDDHCSVSVSADLEVRAPEELR